MIISLKNTFSSFLGWPFYTGFTVYMKPDASNYNLTLKDINRCPAVSTVLPAEFDSDAMLSLQSYKGLRIDRSLVY